MKLSRDSEIAREKVTRYLLKPRDEDEPNGRQLRVVSIWMIERATGLTKFVTLIPGRDEFEMFSRVALKTDVPKHGLRRGDVATIVEYHQGLPGQEPGYSLEVFNAVGESVAVITLSESEIEPLTAKAILHIRPLASAA
jgi:hypothetical protein